MENLKETKTADLIAEWGKLETKIADRKRFMMVNKSEQDDIDYLETHLAQRNSIATELDRRCSEANMASDGNGNLKTPCSIELPITEFCLLCDWLLLKGGNDAR